MQMQSCNPETEQTYLDASAKETSMDWQL